jgi:hypothetical protein
MSQQGPQFIATGTYIERVLDQSKPHGERRFLKLISCLFVKFDVSVR